MNVVQVVGIVAENVDVVEVSEDEPIGPKGGCVAVEELSDTKGEHQGTEGVARRVPCAEERA